MKQSKNNLRESNKIYMRNYIKKPEVKVKRKQYEEEHKEERKEYFSKYYKKSTVRKRIRNQYQTNPKIKQRKRKYIAQQRKENPQIRIRDRLRASIRGRLKKYYENGKIPINKNIDYKKIIEYLSPPPKDITLYHIDHIIPLSSFDLTKPDEFKEATAPKNHQRLLIKDNLSKGSKILKQF